MAFFRSLISLPSLCLLSVRCIFLYADSIPGVYLLVQIRNRDHTFWYMLDLLRSIGASKKLPSVIFRLMTERHWSVSYPCLIYRGQETINHEDVNSKALCKCMLAVTSKMYKVAKTVLHAPLWLSILDDLGRQQAEWPLPRGRMTRHL